MIDRDRALIERLLNDGAIKGLMADFLTVRFQQTAALLSAAPEPDELTRLRDEVERMRGERDVARAAIANIVDRATYADSYGIVGSDFICCHFCSGGGAPGVTFAHAEYCPIARYESVASEWFSEMRDAEARAEKAEAALAALTQEPKP